MDLLRRHLPISLILAAFLGLAGLYSVVNPLFESPDEIWHYEYVRWLVEGNGLPEPADVGHAPWHQEGSQPPLYYLSSALLTSWIPTDNAPAIIRYNPHAAIGQGDAWGNRNVMAHGAAETWPWRGVALAAHLIRFFSVLLGALTVLFTYLTARRLLPTREWVAVLAGALVAFNPQFIFISAAVNNDNLVTTICVIGVWLAMVVLTQGRRDSHGRWQQAAPQWQQVAVLGVLAGLAALSKLSGLLLAPYVGLVLLVVAWRRRRWQELLGWAVVSGGCFVLVAGWHYVRNTLLFGDPLLLTAMFAILPKRPLPPTTAELLVRGIGVWQSFWAVFGWYNVVVDPWVYQFYTWLTALGVAGLLVGTPLQRFYGRGQAAGLRSEDAQDTRQSATTPPRNGNAVNLVLLAFWLVAVLLLLVQWATMRYPQGRLLFPAISVFGILLAGGLAAWFPRHLQRWAVSGIALLLVIIAAVAPWRWIAPAYAAPPSLPVGTSLPNSIDANFGDAMRLAGFELGAMELHPGDELPVTLYWDALVPLDRDYSVFVHLTDENQILQAQRDSYPGLGNAPTSDWTSGVVHVDPQRVTVPTTAAAPARLKVDVGLYDYTTGARLLVNGYDHWTLGYVTLLPAADDRGYPNPVDIKFGDQMALIGFELDKRVVAPGESLTVTLWWEALDDPVLDYTVFVHYILPPDATWAQKDEEPQDGASPTSGWAKGDVIDDRYTIALPVDAPPGVYFVEIGVYDKLTNDRLQVNFSDKGIVLGQFRVVAPE